MTDSTSTGGAGDARDASDAAEHESAEVASTSPTDTDRHQGLVEDATVAEPADAEPSGSQPVDTAAGEADAWQRTWEEAGGGDLSAADRHDDAGIEPTVIAPSTLRGHSHDTGPQDDAVSSLESPPEEPGETESSTVSSEASEPPALVEPPRLSLRGGRKPDLDDTAPFEGLGAASGGAAASGAAASASQAEAEPTPTVAMPQADAEPRFEVADDAVAEATPTTTVTHEPERTGTITVDDETARAAATGTPIVLVESPTPPRKKGARGVGFVVVLLATIVFGALLAAGFVAVGYLFDRDFSLDETLQSLWTRPAWIVPVLVFFVAYWLTTIIVNRAGWWAHVLGGFIIALLAYAGHIGGTYLETQSNQWDVLSLTSLGVDDVAQLVLAPMSVVTFVLAREVPIWLGGIVSRRGRRVKERNRAALEDFERENAERMAEYEASRA